VTHIIFHSVVGGVEINVEGFENRLHHTLCMSYMGACHRRIPPFGNTIHYTIRYIVSSRVVVVAPVVTDEPMKLTIHC
jgi:hypothetical protein